MNTYDDSKYGVVERLYLGPIQDSMLLSVSTILKRFYPKGPIAIKKFGAQVIATTGGTECTLYLRKSGTTIATVVCSTDSAPWTIASKASTATVGPGSYISIVSSTGVATGSVCCFIDYVRLYSSKWD
jgi:hypothetical protein